MIDRLPYEPPEFHPGWVWLVGAGPGDPGLLTLLAWHALRSADVVVHDALVGTDILSLVRDDAELEYAGKRGGKPSPRQPDITARLIELAKQGKRVLRLKGGDPFVFGRGGEEAAALVQAGVPFRVVPGVTSGIAGPAYAGIPVTTRGTNHAVTLVTGSDAGGDVPDGLDWDALAKGSPVLIVYMALRHMKALSDRLLASGRAPDEGVAVISDATLPSQRVLITRLDVCAEETEIAAMKAPAIVCVGPVVALRRSLDWFGATP